MRRVLITGGCGFIGGHLAGRMSADGWAVDLLDNFSRARRDDHVERLLAVPDVRLIERDLTEPDAFDGLGMDYDCVIHLAAIVGVTNVVEGPYRVLDDNVRLTTAVLAWAQRQSRLERLVFASTSEVYAGSLELGMLPVPTPETVPLALPPLERPRSTYLLSKLYGEALCLHSDLPVTVIRPHNVYGPRMGLAHVIPELLKRAHDAADGDALSVYSVEHSRTFCHVDDALEMIVRTIDLPDCSNEILNVGRQSPEVQIGELARIVLEVVGRDLRVEPLPPTSGSPERRAPDMAKTARLTGYTAAVGLEDGVRQVYDWYRANAFAGAT